MTDKQLERANQIKKELSELEKLKGVALSFDGIGDINIFDSQVYADFEKIHIRLNNNWHRLCDDKIAALKKEFAKL